MDATASRGALSPPQQSRSRRTLERIVAASLEILAEEGPEALTVQEIVARAESSVGSFYARFRGKSDLLDYLRERVWREASERWERALASRDWAALDLPQLAEGAARLLLDAERSHARYLKGLGRAGDDAYQAFRARLLDGLGGVLLTRRDRIEHPDPALAVRLGLRAVLGVVSPGGADEGSPPAERLVQECRLLLLSYLQPPGLLPADGRGPVDFFDVWG